MLLAPQPTLTATTGNLAPGVRGVAQTIRIMRQLVKAGRVDPYVRQAATTIIFLQPAKMPQAEAAKLLEFCQQTIRYTPDVLDVETLSSAAQTLAGRVGDCDDQSVLLAALLEAVGIQTRFIVTGYNSPDELEHVYLEACIDGTWLAADPTERGPLGWEPEDPVIRLVEKV